MSRNLGLAALLILSADFSFAQETDRCADPKTRTEKMQCLNVEVNDIDGVLGRTYNNIRNELAAKCGGAELCEKIRTHLRKSQINWIVYRDSFCELETLHLDAGDNSDIQFAACLMSETTRKIEDLRVQQLNFRRIYRKDTKPEN